VPTQLGTETAVGDADEPVAFATTVLAACGNREPAVTVPQAGAVLAPVETIACPAVDPAGFSSWTGFSVAAKTVDESASSAAAKSRFISLPIRNDGVAANG
jgi:hypothetical protein